MSRDRVEFSDAATIDRALPVNPHERHPDHHRPPARTSPLAGGTGQG